MLVFDRELVSVCECAFLAVCECVCVRACAIFHITLVLMLESTFRVCLHIPCVTLQKYFVHVWYNMKKRKIENSCFTLARLRDHGD